jgi:hypothetical protein
MSGFRLVQERFGRRRSRSTVDHLRHALHYCSFCIVSLTSAFNTAMCVPSTHPASSTGESPETDGVICCSRIELPVFSTAHILQSEMNYLRVDVEGRISPSKNRFQIPTNKFHLERLTWTNPRHEVLGQTNSPLVNFYSPIRPQQEQ